MMLHRAMVAAADCLSAGAAWAQNAAPTIALGRRHAARRAARLLQLVVLLGLALPSNPVFAQAAGNVNTTGTGVSGLNGDAGMGGSRGSNAGSGGANANGMPDAAPATSGSAPAANSGGLPTGGAATSTGR